MISTAAAGSGVGDRRLTRRLAAVRPDLLTGLAGGVVILLGLVAVLAPVISPYNPNTVNITQIYAGISSAHWLGTDSNGRDLLARLIWGSRTALLGPLVVVVLATILATTLALLAAWARGWVDGLVSRLLDLLFAFPGLLLAILAVAVFGKGLPAAAVAFAVSYTPYIARVVRAAALRELALPYVTALRSNGISEVSIIVRHILPNVTALIIAQSTVMFGYAMMDLAAISFLGLGVQNPTADWGSMVASGTQGILAGHPQQAMFAAALIVVTVVAVNLVGTRLGDRKDGPAHG